MPGSSGILRTLTGLTPGRPVADIRPPQGLGDTDDD
jgi:hypothetical protein